jgi:hypothetical protein
MSPTTFNWRAALLPLIAAVFVTYEEIRDDWDNNPSTVFNRELVVMAWSGVASFFLGTTTGNQTAQIAKEQK